MKPLQRWSRILAAAVGATVVLSSKLAHCDEPLPATSQPTKASILAHLLAERDVLRAEITKATKALPPEKRAAAAAYAGQIERAYTRIEQWKKAASQVPPSWNFLLATGHANALHFVIETYAIPELSKAAQANDLEATVRLDTLRALSEEMTTIAVADSISWLKLHKIQIDQLQSGTTTDAPAIPAAIRAQVDHQFASHMTAAMLKMLQDWTAAETRLQAMAPRKQKPAIYPQSWDASRAGFSSTAQFDEVRQELIGWLNWRRSAGIRARVPSLAKWKVVRSTSVADK